MNWKPNKWIAVLLGFFFQPLGMLYIARIQLAFIYFLAGIATGVLESWIEVREFGGLQYVPFVFILMIVCASHIYLILKKHAGLSNRPWFSRWYGLISFPLVLAFALFSFRAFLYEPFRMPSGSMSPSINPGDLMVASKWGYGHYGAYGVSLGMAPMSKELKRGDVVVFEFPKNRSTSYAKRIVGLPGDVVEYQKDSVIVNGKALDRSLQGSEGDFEMYRESLDDASYMILVMPDRESIEGVVSVPDGHVFVIGDNRDNSNDSRYWGFVPVENIVGKVAYVF